jgi:hypothetical protein
MPKHFAATIQTLIVIGAFCPSFAGARTTEVNVVVDFTSAGRKVVHPTEGHPAYYYPVLGGFEELGAGEAGERPPVKASVAHTVALELARQGYVEMSPTPFLNGAGQVTYRDGTLVTVPLHPASEVAPDLNAPGNIPLTRAMLEAPDGPYSLKSPGGAKAASLAAHVLNTVDPVHGPVMSGLPSLILCVQYGYANPEVASFGSGPSTGNGNSFTNNDPIYNNNFNQRQMLGLVAGNTLGNLDDDFERQSVMQRSGQDRYFVMVSAYDFDAYRTGHRVVLLWQAKMSAPSDALTEFSSALDALARAGGPFYGRETVRPAALVLPVTPDGHVEVGEPQVKDYSFGLPAAAPSGAK